VDGAPIAAHLRSIYLKLGIGSRVELTRLVSERISGPGLP